MSTHTTILIPLDGTPFSQMILAHVEALFPPQSTELILLNIAMPVEGQISTPALPVTTTWPVAIHQSARDAELAHHPIYASQEEASARAHEIQTLEPIALRFRTHGYRVKCDVWFGTPAEGIVGFVETHPVDLIAMATHARSGVGHLLYGSVSEEVLRQAGKPILLIHPPEEEFEM
jgi:nucleotide-binding universal stress UspA family protein